MQDQEQDLHLFRRLARPIAGALAATALMGGEAMANPDTTSRKDLPPLHNSSTAYQVNGFHFTGRGESSVSTKGASLPYEITASESFAKKESGTEVQIYWSKNSQTPHRKEEWMWNFRKGKILRHFFRAQIPPDPHWKQGDVLYMDIEAGNPHMYMISKKYPITYKPPS